MSGQTTYEIYTLANGRWLVDTQFKGTQRDGAIEEAKRIAAQPGIEQVKVVRETFDLNDGLIKESIVFKSELTGDAKSSNTSARGAVFDPYGKVAPSAKPSTGTRRRRAGNRTQFRGRGAVTQSQRTASPSTISAPARLAYKMLFIVMLSFAFATTMTLLYNQTLLS